MNCIPEFKFSYTKHLDSGVTVERHELPTYPYLDQSKKYAYIVLDFFKDKDKQIEFFHYIRNNVIVTPITSILELVIKGFTSVELSQFTAP